MKTNRMKLLFCLLYVGLTIIITDVLIKANQLHFINGDAPRWIIFAQQIQQKHSIGDAIWWPPLYALLLRPFVQLPLFPFIISFLQALGSLFIVGLVGKLLGTINPLLSVRFRIMISVVLLFMPAFFLINRVTLAETTFLLFYICHAYGLVKFITTQRVLWFATSLLFLVLATFTKPTSLFLHVLEYPLLFATLHVSNVKIKRALPLLLTALLLPSVLYGAWIWRNHSVTGVYGFANDVNYNLLAHNYVHLMPYIGTAQSKPGDELNSETNKGLRQYLFQTELPKYIAARTDASPVSETQKYAYAARLARQQIFAYLPIYVPLHYLKSLALFVPDNWETLRHMWPHAKVLILVSDILIGLSMIGLFLGALLSWTKRLLQRQVTGSKGVVQLLVLCNIFYLLSVIGPTGFDDGGRFSFILYPWILLFIGSTNFNLLVGIKRWFGKQQV